MSDDWLCFYEDDNCFYFFAPSGLCKWKINCNFISITYIIVIKKQNSKQPPQKVPLDKIWYCPISCVWRTQGNKDGRQKKKKKQKAENGRGSYNCFYFHLGYRLIRWIFPSFAIANCLIHVHILSSLFFLVPLVKRAN